MSEIFDTMDKNNTTERNNNKEINRLNSAERNEALLESTDQPGEKSRREENKSDNSSVREQIFHPLDRIF